MPIESLEEILKTLTYHQGIVLYWTCKDLKYEDIAERYGYKKSWCVWQMSFVYHKLGIDQKDPRTGLSLHWNQRREIIKGEVCPALMRLINDDPKNIEAFPLIAEGVVVGPPSETQPPPPEPPEPPQLPSGPLPDPNKPPPDDFYPPEIYRAWLMVLEDENGTPPPPPPPTDERVRIIRLVLFSIVVCGAVSAIGYVAFQLGRGGFGQTPVTVVEATQNVVSDTLEPSPTSPAETFTSVPSDTLVPTAILTITPTNTPLPTETKSPIGLVKGDELSDSRVTLKLTDIQYNQKYDKIGAKVAPISFFFDFTNHSGETIVLQFDSSDFQSVDNTGYEADCWFYHISGAGENVNEPLNNGDTRVIVARCGLENLNPNVTTVTLTIHPFSSLAENTWIAEVPH